MFLPEPIEVGSTHRIAQSLVERLACFALVDNARGQTLPFHPNEVEGEIHAEITSLDKASVCLAIHGRTAASSDGFWRFGANYWQPNSEWPRSMRTELRGTARWDRTARRFTAFELVAIGERQGRTTFNGRRRDSGRGPIGFVFELAPPCWRVAPTFINLYDVPWVQPISGF